MKTLKNLFMLCAGLSLFACSSSDDDATNQFPEGKGAVTVKLVNPLSRSMVAATSAAVTVTGDITVKLYEEGNLTTPTQTQTISSASEAEVTFWGITDPSLITAEINDGLDGISAYGAIENYQMAPNVAPAFGKTNSFTKTSNSETNGGNTYQMYTAELTMAVPFARIEFTVKRSDAASAFTTLDLGGVYLDNLYATGSAADVTDYKHPQDVDIAETFKTTATGIDAVLHDEPTSALSFTAANALAPGEDLVYAYNIVPASGTNMPVIKVWFNNATKTSESVLPYQYAIVDTYSVSGFEAGKIYKITASALTDANIKTTESGLDVDYAIDVTVHEATWTVENIAATWQ